MHEVSQQDLIHTAGANRARDLRAARRAQDVELSYTERMIEESMFDFSDPEATLKDEGEIIQADCIDCDYICAEVPVRALLRLPVMPTLRSGRALKMRDDRIKDTHMQVTELPWAVMIRFDQVPPLRREISKEHALFIPKDDHTRVPRQSEPFLMTGQKWFLMETFVELLLRAEITKVFLYDFGGKYKFDPHDIYSPKYPMARIIADLIDDAIGKTAMDLTATFSFPGIPFIHRPKGLRIAVDHKIKKFDVTQMKMADCVPVPLDEKRYVGRFKCYPSEELGDVYKVTGYPTFIHPLKSMDCSFPVVPVMKRALPAILDRMNEHCAILNTETDMSVFNNFRIECRVSGETFQDMIYSVQRYHHLNFWENLGLNFYHLSPKPVFGRMVKCLRVLVELGLLSGDYDAPISKTHLTILAEAWSILGWQSHKLCQLGKVTEALQGDDVFDEWRSIVSDNGRNVLPAVSDGHCPDDSTSEAIEMMKYLRIRRNPNSLNAWSLVDSEGHLTTITFGHTLNLDRERWILAEMVQELRLFRFKQAYLIRPKRWISWKNEFSLLDMPRSFHPPLRADEFCPDGHVRIANTQDMIRISWHSVSPDGVDVPTHAHKLPDNRDDLAEPFRIISRRDNVARSQNPPRPSVVITRSYQRTGGDEMEAKMLQIVSFLVAEHGLLVRPENDDWLRVGSGMGLSSSENCRRTYDNQIQRGILIPGVFDDRIPGGSRQWLHRLNRLRVPNLNEFPNVLSRDAWRSARRENNRALRREMEEQSRREIEIREQVREFIAEQDRLAETDPFFFRNRDENSDVSMGASNRESSDESDDSWFQPARTSQTRQIPDYEIQHPVKSRIFKSIVHFFKLKEPSKEVMSITRVDFEYALAAWPEADRQGQTGDSIHDWRRHRDKAWTRRDPNLDLKAKWEAEYTGWLQGGGDVELNEDYHSRTWPQWPRLRANARRPELGVSRGQRRLTEMWGSMGNV
jgi:hypothetical protein